MSSTAVITGNIGRVGELRTTKSGKSVVNFSVAETQRRRVQGSDNQWEDTDPIWYDLTAWGRIAENIVATGNDGEPLIKGGTHVIVTAHYSLKDGYTNSRGEEVGPSSQLIVDDIGVSMRAFPATSPRLSKSGGSSSARPSAPAKSAQKPVQKPVQKEEDDFDDVFGDDDDDFFG